MSYPLERGYWCIMVPHAMPMCGFSSKESAQRYKQERAIDGDIKYYDVARLTYKDEQEAQKMTLQTQHHEMCTHQNGAICSAGDWSITQTNFDRERCRLEFTRHLHVVLKHHPKDGLTVSRKEVTK